LGSKVRFYTNEKLTFLKGVKIARKLSIIL